ncbi:Olfactory receptor 12D2 [Cricetulus griseus]|nr:Olfactory receptor 12D2 [Cricetulus griseus]
MYFVNVAGNGAILMIVILDSRLHSPMYFFLGNLACLDICYSTVTVPKMLVNFLSTSKAISFLGCITQLHFFHFLGSTEALLLTVMAFDRFMAICKPLHYSVIMNRQVCIQMAVTIWAIPFLHALLHSIMTSHLSFCGSNHIHHFFCDVKPLLELACGNTELNRWLLNTLTGTIAIGLFFLTFLSYFYIITYLFLKTRSCSMLHKALSTCASHFMVVIIFYAPVLFIYISPASGSSLEEDRIIAVMYTVVTPALNPLIYTLRNKEVLINLLFRHRTISFLGCITQLHFFHFLGSTEAILLAVMAFDRFVAICNPLRYTAIMNPQLCLLLAAMAWTTSFFYALMHSVMTAQLNFCHSHKLSHFFCDVKPLLEVACDNQWLLSVVTGSISMGAFLLTLLSYFYIIAFLLFKNLSFRMLRRALSTCTSHFMVVCLFYGPVGFTYIRPTAASASSMSEDRMVAIIYSAVTPVLNPLIYTLRNKEVMLALKKLFGKLFKDHQLHGGDQCA